MALVFKFSSPSHFRIALSAWNGTDDLKELNRTRGRTTTSKVCFDGPFFSVHILAGSQPTLWSSQPSSCRDGLDGVWSHRQGCVGDVKLQACIHSHSFSGHILWRKVLYMYIQGAHHKSSSDHTTKRIHQSDNYVLFGDTVCKIQTYLDGQTCSGSTSCARPSPTLLR